MKTQPKSFCRCAVCVSGSLQEMMAIMTSIYDMMGRYTLPSVRDDSPFEHVEKFFQVFYLLQLLNPSNSLFVNELSMIASFACLTFFRKWIGTEMEW